MFIFFYPTEMERHAFDAKSDKEAAEELLRCKIECEDIRIYNLNTKSYNSNFCNAEEFANDCNNESIDLNEYWAIALNVSAKEMEQMREELLENNED